MTSVLDGVTVIIIGLSFWTLILCLVWKSLSEPKDTPTGESYQCNGICYNKYCDNDNHTQRMS